ncbi:MAG TPA: LysR family transcriptional regulator [Rhizomicrobium sp.]|jgi:DNA-binding transcriptional LysR family regulator|nr:LysR family transcriptional regulator [Rhizomicrobium sp.]
MPGQPLPPTLDQITIFLAIVETGSFAAAARKLGRATSVISYAVANLEAQLGVTLFARAGTRKPVLTDAGRAILADSRGIAIALDGLLARARGLTQGLEAEVSLVVDVMLPARKLVRVLDEFRRKFPTVALRLRVETLGAVTQAVLDGLAVFGISGPLDLPGDLLTRGPAGSVKLVPVAAPDHPLAQAAGPVSANLARDHIQLVLTDRSALTEGRDFGVLSVKSWRLADLGAKHALLLAGLGWGNMPKPMVSDDLKRGRLVVLDIETPLDLVYRFHTVHRSDTPPGPAASWLMERLAMA